MKMRIAFSLAAMLICSGCGKVRDVRSDFAATCSVHRVTMKEDVVPLVYGLIRPEPPGSPSWREYPNANDRYPGGCLVGEDKRARLHYCPKCRAAAKDHQNGEHSTH